MVIPQTRVIVNKFKKNRETDMRNEEENNSTLFLLYIFN